MANNAYGVNIVSDEAGLRARLLAQALAALERGEEVSLRGVARAAGVSAMAPYRHFTDKAALLLAVAVHGFDRLRQAMLAADRGEAADALVAQGQAYLAFARAQPALFRLMFSDHKGPPPARDDNAYGLMARRVRELAPPDLAAATLACWSTVHGLATLALDGGMSGDPAIERAALATVVRGVVAS